MTTRTATARYQGFGKEGKGQLDTPSGVLDATPYSYNTRFGDEKGTNPEELIAAAHAERADAVARAQQGILAGIGSARDHLRAIEPAASRALVRPGDEREDRTTQDRYDTQPGVHEEADEDVDRHPGRIEQRKHARTGQRAAHRIEFAQCLPRHRQFGPAQSRVEDQRRERGIELHAGTDQQARADAIEQRECPQRKQEHQREEGKRLHDSNIARLNRLVPTLHTCRDNLWIIAPLPLCTTR